MVKLTIKGIHYPGALITDAWREISFMEIPERMVCNLLSKMALEGAYGDLWVDKQVYVLRSRIDIAGQPTYDLQMIPADQLHNHQADST